MGDVVDMPAKRLKLYTPDGKETPAASFENLQQVVMHCLPGLGCNAMAGGAVWLFEPAPWDDSDDFSQTVGRRWIDSDPARMRSYCRDEFKVDFARVGDRHEAVEAAAAANIVNPFLLWLNRLAPWDCVARICELPGRLWGCVGDTAEEQAYLETVLLVMLCGAVTRAEQPGAKFDHCAVVYGAEGIGKSSSLAALLPVPEWFSDSISLSTIKEPKREAEELAGKVIVEMPELDKFGARDQQGALKSFIARQVVSVRPAYARYERDIARTAVLFATTNQSRFLYGEGDHRRFLPMGAGLQYGQFGELSWLREHREQIWAEALAYRQQHGVEALQLSGVMREEHARQVDRVRVSDGVAEAVDGYLDREFTAEEKAALRQDMFKGNQLIQVDPQLLFNEALGRRGNARGYELERLHDHLERRPDFVLLEGQNRINGRRSRRVFRRVESALDDPHKKNYMQRASGTAAGTATKNVKVPESENRQDLSQLSHYCAGYCAGPDPHKSWARGQKTLVAQLAHPHMELTFLGQKNTEKINKTQETGSDFLKYESECAGVPAVPPDTPDIDSIRRRYTNYMQNPDAVWLDGSRAPFRHIWQITPSIDEQQLAALAAWEIASNAHGAGVAAVRELCLTDRWGDRATFRAVRRASRDAGDALPRWVPPLPVYLHTESGELRIADKPEWVPFGQYLGAAHHPVLNGVAHAVHLLDYPFVAAAVELHGTTGILADVVI